MDATSMRFRAAGERYARKLDWSAAWTWLLCFGLIAYLGLEGGGYDPLVHDQVGIVAWWVVLAGMAVGAFPRRRLPALAWTALGLFAAFVVWTALSLSWTESVERTWADLARVGGYLGVFALVLFSLSRGSREAQRLIAAVASGIVFVALVALLSRLHPAWFPEAGQTARFLASGRERLSYPLDYWNALACLVAIGLPLILHLGAGARSPLTRGAAAAAIPALGMTIFLTLSRGGIAAAAVAVAVFLCFAADRVPKLFTLLVGGSGAAFLIALTVERPELRHGLESSVAHRQGNEMLIIAAVVCVLVGVLQAAVSGFLLGSGRPGWTRVSRRWSARMLIAGLLVVLVAAIALDAPTRIANGWSEFKRGGEPGKGAGRLGSVAGENRYQFWSAAVRENASKPLTGTGSGTFRFWWTRDGNAPEAVLDTHSLYLQTLGELGIVGLALLAAFLAAILLGGGREVVRARGAERSMLAAALAGAVAFCLTSVFDWMWQVPALAVALLLLASVVVSARGPGDGRQPIPRRYPLRAGFALVAIAVIVAIAIPLASTSLVRQSQADFRAGDLEAALRAARSAQDAQPGAASPRLQEALVLEAERALDPAAAAARAATDREATNWRNWLILSRIEAERGRAGPAVRAYRRAKALNPRSPVFERQGLG